MIRESKALLERSLDSLHLSIELFNRPWDRGRREGVLIFLDRAFELLLKAILASKHRSLREESSKETFGFDKCVRVCMSDARVKCLTEEEAIPLQIINSLRDAAQHYILEVSESQLYLYAQAGVSLYKRLLRDEFKKELSDYFPERVLPVSSTPPKDLNGIIDVEFEEIKKLVAPGHRRGLEALARLRSVAIIDASLSGAKSQPGDDDLKSYLNQVRDGKAWTDIFPGVASLSLDTSGTGMTFSIRLTKKEGVPVHLVPEGTPGATIISVKRVNELDFYSLSLKELAVHLSMSMPRALALIQHLKMQENQDFFHVFQIGSQTHKRYSKKALEHLREKLPKVDMSCVWQAHKPKGKTKTHS
jgi:hypothetical protein